MAGFTLFPAETRVKLTPRAAPRRLLAWRTASRAPPPPPSLARPFRGSQIYALPLSTGRYEWVVAVWKKVGAFAPGFSNADSLLKEAGFYRDQTDPTAPGVVVVNDSSTDSVNFVIDF